MSISRLISVVYHESAKTLNLALNPREDDEDAGTLSLRSGHSKKKKHCSVLHTTGKHKDAISLQGRAFRK